MSGPGRTPGRRTRATPAPDLNADAASSFGPRRSLSPMRSPSRAARTRGSPRKSELPALTARPSNAYGSTGRLSLVEASSSSSTNPFTAARNAAQAQVAAAASQEARDRSPSPVRNTRGAPRNREPREPIVAAPEPAPKTTPVKKGRPRRAVQQPVEEDAMTAVNADDEDDEEEEDSRPDELAALSRRRQLSPLKRNVRAASTEGTTVMENSSNYFPAAAIAQGVQRRSRTASPARPRQNVTFLQPQTGPSGLQAFGTHLQNLLTTIWRHLRNAFNEINWRWLFFFALPSLIGVALYFSSPYFIRAYETLRPIDTVKDYGSSAATSLSTFKNPLKNPFNNVTWGPVIDLKTSARIRELENRLDYLNSKNELSQTAVARLERLIPEHTMVEYKDGKPQIPDIFIRALHDRMNRELGIASTLLASDDQWEEFELVNKVRLRNAFDTLANNAISSAFNHRLVFTSHDVQTYIKKCHESIDHNYIQPLRKEVEERMSSWKNTTDISTLAKVEQVLGERLAALPEVQLTVLAQAIILQNAHDALKSVNHMSASLGAVLIPHLCSPTHDTWAGHMTLSRWLFWFLSPFYDEYRPLPSAVSALEPWFEAGNCWCASPPAKATSTKSKTGLIASPPPVLQLAVLIARPIYPSKITIEHAPAEAVMNIRNAPRTMELWVSLTNSTIRSSVHSASQEIFAARGAQEFPPASQATAGIALDETYVRIGRWVYDPRLANHVQTFPLQVVLQDFGVGAGVSRVVVRALTNWGEEYTCLYRVRLHGDPVEPRKGIVVHEGARGFEGVLFDEEK